MAKRRRLPDLADDQRCTRNGTNWRCHLPRLPGKSYCQKHQLFNLARSQSKSKSKSKPESENPAPPPSFTLREIWAFQNPRVYARIERRIPAESLVEVTPLIPPAPDAACGLFRTSETTEMKDMAGFSHRVWFEMEGEGIYKILPRKGEIWAVDMYGWVEMVTSFTEGLGASGTVLVEEEGEEEGSRVFRRRLYEGCELIRRFTAGELWMFLHRVSEARVLEVHSLLEGCTIAIEGEKEDTFRIEDSNHVQSEACETNMEVNNVEEQAAGPKDNEGGMPQTLEMASNIETIDSLHTLEGISSMEPVNSHQTLGGVSIMEGTGAPEEITTVRSSEGEAKETDQKGQSYSENVLSIPEETPIQNSSN